MYQEIKRILNPTYTDTSSYSFLGKRGSFPQPLNIYTHTDITVIKMPDKASPALVQRRQRLRTFLEDLKACKGMSREDALKALLNMGVTLQRAKMYLSDLTAVGAIREKQGLIIATDGRKISGQ